MKSIGLRSAPGGNDRGHDHLHQQVVRVVQDPESPRLFLKRDLSGRYRRHEAEPGEDAQQDAVGHRLPAEIQGKHREHPCVEKRRDDADEHAGRTRITSWACVVPRYVIQRVPKTRGEYQMKPMTSATTAATTTAR